MKENNRIEEILPNIFHWTAVHPEIGIEVSSYFLATQGILLDPLIPAEGLEWFKENRIPQHVLLTNRLHARHSGKFRDAFRCIIWVHKSGLQEGIANDEVEGFEFGEQLPGKIEALPINAICPDETAFFIPEGRGIVAFADGVIREEEGPLLFVDDELMADTPKKAKEVKKKLKSAFRKIAEERHFDHLFFAHGRPMIGGGREALQQFSA